jgi:hypothetical protein
MRNPSAEINIPGQLDFFKSTILFVLIAVIINVLYYHIWQILTGIPIPKPYTTTPIIVQTLVAIGLSGIVHYAYREKRTKSAFDYLSGLLILVLINAAIFYVLMEVRRLPSINEIKRLFGVAGAPESLLWLSVPIALSSASFGVFLTPRFSLAKR